MNIFSDIEEGRAGRGFLHRTYLVVVSGIFLATGRAAYAQVIDLKYDRWEIKYNCEKRGYESFHYVTVPDTGHIERLENFHDEIKLPRHCRQWKSTPYVAPASSKTKYHRGHGVHQNIWDHSSRLMRESNSMANVVPHAALLNTRGVWRQTEILTECWRDIGTVEVWGGVIWGSGVVTPDALWKIIRIPTGEVNAWMMPNDDSPTAVRMDTYLVTPAAISKYTGLSFDIPPNEYSQKDSRSITRPSNCSLK
jgi:endonuclease G